MLDSNRPMGNWLQSKEFNKTFGGLVNALVLGNDFGDWNRFLY